MHVPMHDPVFAARPAIIDHEHQTTKFDDHTQCSTSTVAAVMRSSSASPVKAWGTL